MGRKDWNPGILESWKARKSRSPVRLQGPRSPPERIAVTMLAAQERRVCVPIYVKYSGLKGPSLIAGNLGGKQVNCAIRQVQGCHLAPGTYHISAPINDPIYRTTAHITSASP